MKKLLLLSLLLLFSLSSFAQGQEWKLNFIGFSDDGKYLAFEQYGVRDDSGFLHSNHYFIDVAANKYARKASMLEEQDYENISLESVRSRSAANNKAVLNQLKIVDGNTGTKVFSANENTSKVTFTHNSTKYELDLDNISNKTKPGEEPLRDSGRLELRLKNKKTKAVQILQKDGNKVNRQMGYGIKAVYLYKGMIAVFLEFKNYFDFGADDYLVVTGKIK